MCVCVCACMCVCVCESVCLRVCVHVYMSNSEQYTPVICFTAVITRFDQRRRPQGDMQWDCALL